MVAPPADRLGKLRTMPPRVSFLAAVLAATASCRPSQPPADAVAARSTAPSAESSLSAVAPAISADETAPPESAFDGDAARAPVLARSPEPEAAPARLATAALRKLAGRRLTLITDVADDTQIDVLPALADQAAAQFFTALGLDEQEAGDWRAIGCLMDDRRRFESVGLVPDSLPKLKSGYTIGDRFWMHNQTSDYYRRHLLLHELVHAVRQSGPWRPGAPWWEEGLAEWLATHQIDGESLGAAWFPTSADAVPGWGRIELLQQAAKEGESLSFAQVRAFGDSAHRELEPYAWCWAAIAFLDGRDATRAAFRALLQDRSRDVRSGVDALLAEYPHLALRWDAYVAELDYGYDFERSELNLTPGSSTSGATRHRVVADHGWQNSGRVLAADVEYHLAADGRCTLADEPRPWVSEPQGVTVRYYRGRPLGELQAVLVAADLPPEAGKAFARPLHIGRGRSVAPEQDMLLWLRINDPPGERADNTGAYIVQVEPVL